jgi:hypothetical protein
MKQDNDFYVGVDVSKAKHAMLRVAAMEKVPCFGEIEATPAAVERFVRKLEKKCSRLQVFLEFNFLDASQRRPPSNLRPSFTGNQVPAFAAKAGGRLVGGARSRYHFFM